MEEREASNLEKMEICFSCKIVHHYEKIRVSKFDIKIG
jgi:hypothetical protein